MTWWMMASPAVCLLTAITLLANGVRRLLSDRMTVAVIVAGYVIYFIVAYAMIMAMLPWRAIGDAVMKPWVW